MIETLQWITLIVCATAALARIPSALQGRNRSLFLIFLLATAAAILSMEQFYLPADRAIGGMNIASVLLRLIIFATIHLIALRVSKAFGDAGAYRLISGPAGLTVLAVFAAALVGIFAMMDPAASSLGLADVGDESARNAALLPFYWTAARGYPAYVALALLPCLVRTVNSSLAGLVRTGAALMAAGAAATAAGFLLEFSGPSLNLLRSAVNNAAVVFFILGLAAVWLARVRATGPGIPGKERRRAS
ncbi:hypothetical protein [Arthrobacter sp. D1-17]